MNKFAYALICTMLASCGPAPVEPPPLEGAKIGAPFALTDQDGRQVSDKSYAGQWRVMYFGFTYCPDICPTDVGNLARGMTAFAKLSPEKRKRTRLIFVSVDPARDTPTQLKAFTQHFLPDMVGLTGSAEAIAAVTTAYGVSVSIAPGQSKQSYLVEHSRATYLMDPDNKPIALISQDETPDAIAAELDRWVK